MSMSNDPLTRPDSSANPGMGKPITVLALVFILGLVTIGFIYLAGKPVSSDDDAKDLAALTPAIQPEAGKPTQAEHGKPYLATNGLSPLPKHGEGITAPIAPTKLITDEAYNAKPPEDSTLPTPDGPIAWTEAHKHVGQTITVKGTIVVTGKNGQLRFLNYDPDWQDKFYIVMFPEAYKLLPDPPEEHYLNKTLLVTGKVTLHRDRPQIQVRDVSQIEVVE